MTTEAMTQRSRRAMLAGAAAGAAALAAGRLMGPPPVLGVDGDPVLLGQYQDSTHETSIRGGGLRIEGGFLPVALIAHGVSNGNAFLASSVAESDVTPDSTMGSGVAVTGRSGSGIGVSGKADDGIGVEAFSTTGRALDVLGQVAFTSAGRDVIGSGASQKDVTPSVGVTVDAKILVTLLGNPSGRGKAVVFSHVEPNVPAGTFRVVLTGPAARAVEFAYFVIS